MTSITPPELGWQMRVFPILRLLGWLLITASLLLGVFALAPTAVDYYGANAKEMRDTALAGSAQLSQLQTLTAIPRWLEPLTFLGVASFMVGIALEFSTIPKLLQNRGQLMSLCFPILVEKGA